MREAARLIVLVGIILACSVYPGCKANHIPSIEDITGPMHMDESTSAEFSMSIHASGVTFQWTCDPPLAGYFTGAANTKTIFKAGKVKADTIIEICVLVNSDQFGPVLKKKQLLLRDVNILTVSEIEGPEFVEDANLTTYMIEAWGDTGITFNWSTDPPDLGEFSDMESDMTDFTAFEVNAETQAEIRVEIRADFYDNILKTKAITILPNRAPQIDEIAVSRTTCLMGSMADYVDLECIAHDPDTNNTLTYEWSSDAGSFLSDDEAAVRWFPPDEISELYISCRVADNEGAATVGKSPRIFVTQYPVLMPIPAPDFICEDALSDETFGLADYTPGNVVVITFWATWSGYTVEQMPVMQEIQDEYEDEDFAMLMISVEDTKTTVSNWISSHSYDFTRWGVDDLSIFTAYKVYTGSSGIPQMIIIDADGNVRYAHLGAISEPETLTIIIDELI